MKEEDCFSRIECGWKLFFVLQEFIVLYVVTFVQYQQSSLQPAPGFRCRNQTEIGHQVRLRVLNYKINLKKYI